MCAPRTEIFLSAAEPALQQQVDVLFRAHHAWCAASWGAPPLNDLACDATAQPVGVSVIAVERCMKQAFTQCMELME